VDENKAICKRCGWTWTVLAKDKPYERCQSCRFEQSFIIKYGKEKCLPWQGEFDRETLTIPIIDGKPFMPGKRTCGHSDCIQSSHVLPNK
jgi:hypothetical protein